jgi:hypothetical protein
MIGLGLSVREGDLRIVSGAVQTWYRHYRVTPNEEASQVLCSTAVNLFNQGHRTQGELSTLLITKFIGKNSVRINAPTSSSKH